MSENVGELEITVNLDGDQVRVQARRTGNEAGREFDRSFERGISQGQGFQRALRQIEHQGRAGARQTAQGMSEEMDRGFFRRVRRGFNSTFSDVNEGLTRFRRIALGIGAALGPIIVPLLALIAEIGPAIAIALPAIAALGAGIAVIALSTKALGQAFKPLVEGFKTLRAPISAILTEGIRPLVKELTGGLIPVLRGGLGDFAAVMNKALASLLRFAGGAQGLGLIRDILAGVARAIKPLARSLTSLVRALLTITRAAVPGFQLFNEAIEDLVLSFDRWIQRLDRTGALQREITESVGVLIQTLKVLGNVFIGIIQGLRVLGQIFAPIVSAFESLGISARDAAKWLTVAAGVFFAFFVPVTALVSLIGSLGTVFTAIGTAIGFLVSPIGLVLVAAAALAGVLFLLWQNSEQFRTAVTNLGISVLNLVQTVWPLLLEAGRNLATIFVEEILPVLRDTARTVGENLAPALQAIADLITDKIIPTIPVVVEQFKEWWPQIREVGKFLGQVAVQMAVVYSIVVGKLIPILIRLGVIAGVALVRNIQTLIAIFRVLQGVARAVGVAAQFVWGNLQTLGRVAVSVNSFLGRLARTVGGALVSAFRSAQNAVGGIVGVFQTIAGVIENVISAVGRLIGALGRIRVPDINLPSLSDIPGLKDGAIVGRPTLALVGEGPWREAVIPDPKARPKRALQLAREIGLDKLILAQQPAAAAGNVVNATFNIYESGSGRVTADRVDARLRLMMGL